MTASSMMTWEIVLGSTSLLLLAAFALWLIFRKRPTAEELERERRQFLSQSGRLVDGMLLDSYEVESDDGRTLAMLLYSYSIGGVNYECSQDATSLRDFIKLDQIRAGFPCSVRYQPGNSQNSIVVAEGWTGLRAGLPVLPAFDDPEPVDTSHLRESR